jgi:phosphatidyl-myo-inositol dimannoside synthase
MGILIITWNFPPRRGGIEYLISQLYAGLKKNHSVFVVTSHTQRGVSEDEKIFRAKWRGLPMFFLYALIKGARVLYRNRDIQIVFGGSALVAPVVVVLARLFGRKSVVQTHGLDIVYPRRLYQLLCVRWLKSCDRVIANSRSTVSLVKEKGTHSDSVCVISPGVDLKRFSAAVDEATVKAAFGLEGKNILLFVGRLARRKGVKEFIQNSLIRIVREVPEACFVVVGDNPSESLAHRDDLLGEIRATVTRLDLAHHVRLLGWLADAELVRIFQIADLIVLPVLPMQNDVEGFGIVLLEAAAAGKPTVATRTGGIPDAVEDGKTGLLVEPGDYESLSRAITDLLRDQPRRLALGVTAQKRVRGLFGWDRIIPGYETTLQSLLPR